MTEKSKQAGIAGLSMQHTLAVIAADDDGVEPWLWCIRCGALCLGREIFLPGAKQQKTIIGTTKPVKCIPRS